MSPETEKLTAEIRVYADPRLKQAAIEEARRQRCALSELVVRALADYLDEPELAEVPRLPPGPKAKDVVFS